MHGFPFFYNVQKKIRTRHNESLLAQQKNFHEFFHLPTVKMLQAELCLHMAMQSRVTEVSSCVTKPRILHSESLHITVVPEVFS